MGPNPELLIHPAAFRCQTSCLRASHCNSIAFGCVDCNVQVRYLVVWNPIIIMATQALLLAMGFTPDPPPEHHPVHGEVAGEGMHGQ